MARTAMRTLAPWAITSYLVVSLPPVASALHVVDVQKIVCNNEPWTVGLSDGQNSDVYWALTIMRTSANAVTVDYDLQHIHSGTVTLDAISSSTTLAPMANTSTVAPMITTMAPMITPTLAPPAVPARRLTGSKEAWNDAGWGSPCDELFLFDGRSPVELPDTWAEARHAFLETCASEGLEPSVCRQVEQQAFAEHPDDESPFDADEECCVRLTQSISSLLPVEVGNATVPLSALHLADGSNYLLARRLKGGVFGAGGRGYSTNPSAYARSYPHGLRTVPYGMSGMSRFGIGMPLAFGMGVGVLGGVALYRMAHMNQFYREGYPGEPCVPQYPCVMNITEDIYRDVLTESTAFIPEEVSYPVRLTIKSITGVDFSPARICPPLGMDLNSTDPATLNAFTAPWMYASGQELFIELSALEEEEDPWWVNLLAVVLICCYCGCCCLCGNQGKKYNRLNESSSDSD